MPNAAPHPCGNRRCSGLAPHGERWCLRCREAEQAKIRRAQDRRRGSARSRGYDRIWEKKREQILARDHRLCRYCKNLGLLTEGNIVDHVRAKAAGGTDDDANLATCCVDCHAEKSIRHDGWYGHQLDPIDRVNQFRPTWCAPHLDRARPSPREDDQSGGGIKKLAPVAQDRAGTTSRVSTLQQSAKLASGGRALAAR